MFYIFLTDDEFSDICAKYNRYVYTVCKNTIIRKSKNFDFPQEEIKDIMQDVFVKFFRQLQKEDHIVNMKSFLARITEFTTINYLEKHARENKMISSVLIDEDLSDENNNPVDIVLKDETFNELVSLIKDLDPKYSSVLLLHHVHNMSLKAIADMHNVSYNTICSWHLRGKRLLAKKLNEKRSGDTKCE